MPNRSTLSVTTTRLGRRTLVFAVAALATPTAGRAQTASPSPVAREGWTTGIELPVARSEFTGTVLDEAIYVAGGFGAQRAFNRFDVIAGEWTELAELPAPRHHLGLAALDGAIFAIGGHNEASSATDTAWRYDPIADAWTDLPPLPQGPRGALGCAALNGLIVAVGGSSGDLSGPATSDVSAFDPASATWEMLPPMPTAREHLAAAVAGGLLIALGGRNGSQFSPEMDTAVERFDPATGEWTRGSALPDGRSGMGVAADATSIVVLGGEGRSGIYSQVQRYDVAADAWSDLPALPVARHGLAAGIVDGRLYAIGGSTEAFAARNSNAVDILVVPPPA